MPGSDIKALIHIVKLRQERTQLQLKTLRGQADKLYAELAEIGAELDQSKQWLYLYRNTAYHEKLCARITVADIETVNYKLRDFEKSIEDIITQQKNISTQIDEVQLEIAKVQKQLRFFSVKEEKYLYLLEN